MRISQRLETSVSLRQLSTSTHPDKAYAATLLLPKTSFPIRADPSIREAAFRERTSEELYKWQWKNLKGPLFVLHDGPPYANGSLHMGHALNKILKDIINRFHVLVGRRVHYSPGWDCHGLPIENKALKELNANHRSLPATQIRTLARQTANREMSVQKTEFRKLGIMADWTSDAGSYRTMDHDYEIRQLRVFKGLVERGLIYRHYRPVYYSPSSHSALAEAELVYADNHISRSVYVTYECKLDGMRDHFRPDLKVNLLVWTTTPWTLPTNMGIAVHSDLEYLIVKRKDDGELFVVGRDRLPLLQSVLGDTSILHNLIGADLLGSRYTSPFQKLGSPFKSLPVIHAPHVTSMSGTGLVHCAPAHGSEDYHVFLNQNLLSGNNTKTSGVSEELRCLVGPDGTFLAEAIKNASWLPENLGARLTGKEVLTDGNTEVIEILKESGRLVKEENITHRYPYDWKTNTPVIVTATSQWFADLSHIKTIALEMLETVQFFPNTTRKRLEAFVKDRSEWCISRQRPWGVPIPALYNDATGEAVMTSDSLEHIVQVLGRQGVDHWWNGPVDDFVSPKLKEEHGQVSWIKGGDTMDVWFDSGTSWTGLVSSLPRRSEDQGTTTTTIADVCLEGSDQHRGWFQSLLLTAVGFSSKAHGVGASEKPIRPYGTIITHGFVLDQKGKKMSKSLGNVMSPMTIVEGGKNVKTEPAHGADALRLWAATVDYGRDSLIGSVVIQKTVESLRKLRNSARFMLGNIPESGDFSLTPQIGEMSLTDRYMMFELYQLEKTAKDAYASYRFPQVVTALDRFAKVTLSSFYLDITKDTLYADSAESPQRKSVIWVMNEVLHTMKMVMAPILPHLAEEIHDASRGLTGSSGQKLPSVFVEGWKSVGEEWNDSKTERDMKDLIAVRGTVMVLLEQARNDKLIRSSLEAGVDVVIPTDLVTINDTEPRLLELLREHESFLKTLFIVSEVSILDEGSLGVDAPEWSRSVTMELQGCDDLINIRVRPSSAHKCPRCWNYSRREEAALCERCTQVLQ
ncbi:tRNA synthetases class I-domain-containing protein [Gautieria morchelliformis]|nr:tRNA synthetases class I-domain-containing protein [Gautieria morchelliformis]